MNLFKQLREKLNINLKKGSQARMTSPIGSEREFLDNISKHALKLYEKQCDIKNFTKLVLSDPENTSHNRIVEELFKKDVKDPLEDKKLSDLANNEQLLQDLGLLD